MANEIIRQQEIQDHKDLMEKLRECCDRLDELFRIYDTLQQAVPDHNASANCHQDIREDILRVDEREGDHYAETDNRINTVNRDLTDATNRITTNIAAIENSLRSDINNVTNTVDAVASGNFVYNQPIQSSVKSTTYANANNGKVLLNSAATAGYNMLFRVKSTNGVYTAGAHNKKFVLNYTSDDTIASAANRADKVNTLMDEDGNAKFSNDVTVVGALTAATINGHITETVDNATNAATANSATSSSYLTANSDTSAGTHRLIYTSGQLSGYAGSNNSASTVSYPAGATTVFSSGSANVQNLRLLWGAASGYWHDLFVSPNQRYIWHRDVSNGTAYNWRRIVEEDNSVTWNINIAGSANRATAADNATHAVSADTAAQATNATNAVNAQLATNANHAATADNATNAANANYATTAGSATSAASADKAITAYSATNDADGNPIHIHYATLTTNQTISGNKTLSGATTISGDLLVNRDTPEMKFSNTVITKNTNPSGDTVLSNIEFTDKSKNTLGAIRETITATGSSTLDVACYNLKGKSSSKIGINFATKSATSGNVILTNVSAVIPDTSGGVEIGNTTNKIGMVTTEGIRLDNDGVGTIKLLARAYTSNTVTNAYASAISGDQLFPVTLATSNVVSSNGITNADAKIVINNNEPQSGSWQPLQILSGAWRNGGNYIIGLYRRVL